MQPLVMTDEAGTVVDAAMTDEKGYRKSLEQGELWVRNAQTRRLLPHGSSFILLSIYDEGGWYRAVVRGLHERSAQGNETEKTAGATDPTESGASRAEARGVSGAAGEEHAGGRDVLARLYEVVRDRQREMPEGSYTTHLFERGLEKIRKKTGEEAVELLLARDREDMVAESADLLYHLLVLLRGADIEVQEVLAELDRRLSK
ncbi:MAG: phosphoribosyl-ATP diphosphatase [Spirochaetaceae bacterium]